MLEDSTRVPASRIVELELARIPEPSRPGTPTDTKSEYVGREGFMEWLGEWLSAFEDWQFVVDRVLDRGRRAGAGARTGFGAVARGAASSWRTISATSGAFATASRRACSISMTGARPSKPPGCGSRALTACPAARKTAQHRPRSRTRAKPAPGPRSAPGRLDVARCVAHVAPHTAVEARRRVRGLLDLVLEHDAVQSAQDGSVADALFVHSRPPSSSADAAFGRTARRLRASPPRRPKQPGQELVVCSSGVALAILDVIARLGLRLCFALGLRLALARLGFGNCGRGPNSCAA